MESVRQMREADALYLNSQAGYLAQRNFRSIHVLLGTEKHWELTLFVKELRQGRRYDGRQDLAMQAQLQ